ncbi:hypothetical protein GASC598B02_013410 [Gilliamella apicola SCGC AB-598-B02]|nr:hypothetical protein GASC598B02_013410 [Gilliamella apicola SCGC AB-598-B02]
MKIRLSYPFPKNKSATYEVIVHFIEAYPHHHCINFAQNIEANLKKSNNQIKMVANYYKTGSLYTILGYFL